MKKTLAALFVGLFLICQPVYGLELGDAKAQGLVGETAMGYLAPVNTADQVVKNLVNSINAQRKQYYQDIAKKNNTPLPAVEQLAGKKAIEKTPAGQFVDNGTGWRKK
ncbi:MAG: YdbL family protein [Proteobacteria bacterium]|nr:YdbL family protein [Pseudomonadota bacterium]MBU1140489.1 YdbL family protein [Pseudomonadota bacterium]MBU1232012.1 YdbL family protein [Pseudomonadota bacterium]MBU1417517.1 YdbL family protein [Pseudomonadota bacterium]MBU1456206.1 YdbL family protein [Pseudomonadota bacterium]